MVRVRRIVGSIAFYPVTLTYLAAVLIIVAIAIGLLTFVAAVIILAAFVCFVLLWSLHREVSKVHTLVNSKHDEMATTIGKMAARIDELLDALTTAGVTIPQDKAGVDRERKPR